MKLSDWHQMKLILEQALERAPAARRAYVAQACAQDTALRAEVDSLLDEADADTGGFLESPATLPPVPPQARVEWLGRRIGGRRILREIGAGGMGQVFLAESDSATWLPPVAVKVMRSDVDSAALRRRFAQEQRIHAQLDHGLIARLLDTGTSDGQPYMVLEHIEGQPIDAYCRQHRLDVRQRVALFVEVCSAVQHVHALGIVHRDIKPANLLVTAAGRPKLLDFGIAECLADTAPDAPSGMAHLEGIAMFTPECAAPEQLQNQPLTQATDIYGLGLLLYRLLTGHVPHEAHRSGLTLVHLRSICNDEPLCASSLVERTGVDEEAGLPEAGALGRLLKGELDRILSRALARRPADRYGSVAAFGEALRAYLHPFPVGGAGAQPIFIRDPQAVAPLFAKLHRHGVMDHRLTRRLGRRSNGL